ncbi:MAG TPA: response regulator [Candidatus Moranbacteria bacterium]|nr:response regulator [Candidatus Moranbacteria bacterium]HRY27672.1 response regulator [Candidatus Moranbacteria bacterium]HSA08005.1 response regulator [Candidatus Moranbacteria bacterium]
MNKAEKRGALVVDENEEVTKVIAEFLKIKDYEPYVVHKISEALVIFKEKREEIGLVILDMPILGVPSVVETFFCLKHIDPEVKFIITSGFFNYETAESKLEKPIGFVRKPFGWKELADLIGEIEKTL